MPVRKKLKTGVEDEEFLTITVPLKGYVLEDVTHLILHEPPTVNVGYRVPNQSEEKENQNKETNERPVADVSTDNSDIFTCEVCDKTFKTPYSLRRHKLQDHPASPLCDECADNLGKPLRAIQSPFSCSRCGKYQQAVLAPEERDVPSPSKRKRLPWGNVCPYCEKSLSDPFNVKRHIIDVHKIALSEVDSAIAQWRKENDSAFAQNEPNASPKTPSTKTLSSKTKEAEGSIQTKTDTLIISSDSEVEDFHSSLRKDDSDARKSFPLSKAKNDKGGKISRKSLPPVSKGSSLENVDLPIPEIVHDPKRPNVIVYICPECTKPYADINKHLNRFHRINGYKSWELAGKMPPQKKLSSKVRDKCPYCSVPVIKLDVHLSNFHKEELLKEKEEKAKEDLDLSAGESEQLPKSQSKERRGRPRGTFKTDSKYKKIVTQIRKKEEIQSTKEVVEKQTDTLALTPRILKKDLPSFAIIEEVANDPILRDLFPFPCTGCNKTFKENNKLQKHLKTHSK